MKERAFIQKYISLSRIILAEKDYCCKLCASDRIEERLQISTTSIKTIGKLGKVRIAETFILRSEEC